MLAGVLEAGSYHYPMTSPDQPREPFGSPQQPWAAGYPGSQAYESYSGPQQPGAPGQQLPWDYPQQQGNAQPQPYGPGPYPGAPYPGYYPAAPQRRQGMLVGGIILVVLGGLAILGRAASVANGQATTSSGHGPGYAVGYLVGSVLFTVGPLVGGIIMIVRSKPRRGTPPR